MCPFTGNARHTIYSSSFYLYVIVALFVLAGLGDCRDCICLSFPVCPVLLLLYVLRAVNSWNRTEPQYERLTINKDDGDDESEPFAFVAFNQYSAGEREPYQLKML